MLTLPQPAPVTNTFGRALADHRRRRGLSQLDLALEAEVSQRHVSFLETGRAAPSRAMVLHLSEVLDLPLRARNALLHRAGFAPAYPERSMQAPELAPIEAMLDFTLRRHEPYPCLVIDAGWNLLRANDATVRLLAAFLAPERMEAFGTRPNLGRLMFHPEGLRPFVRDWEVFAARLLRRGRREAEAQGDAGLVDLMRDLGDMAGETLGRAEAAHGDDPLPAVLPLTLIHDMGDLALFTALTTIGTPIDVTLQEIRLETLFPADTATDARLKRLTGVPGAADTDDA